MQGVERAHTNAAISAVLKGFYDLLQSTVEEALRIISAYGKNDTLGMDAGPEITICESLTNYDNGSTVITEEADRKGLIVKDTFFPNNPDTFRTMFISDPTDRSNQLKSFFGEYSKDKKIGEILNGRNTIAKWEAQFGGPATITGSTSAISCIRRGLPIFSVIVNYITRQLFVSCAAGNRVIDLPETLTHKIDLDYVCENGKVICFLGVDNKDAHMRRFVTFLGDAGKVGYRENFEDSGLFTKKDASRFLHYAKPGGPSRVLYLSTMQPSTSPIGLILANGEKIGEWIHWLAFIRFARSVYDESQPALVLYEVFQKRPWTKEGVLMSTHPNYSVFRQYDGKLFVDTSHLLRMQIPSQYRSTLIVAPRDNRWARKTTSQFNYRQIIL